PLEAVMAIWHPQKTPIKKAKMEKILRTVALVADFERRALYAQLRVPYEEHKAFVERIQKLAQDDTFQIELEE
ncbi:MAG: hypothetical protein NUV49_03580, partial [Patescibacteria group bacterium]|nr:hypothetical protein [Patescibacteria group bacterium]